MLTLKGPTGGGGQNDIILVL